MLDPERTNEQHDISLGKENRRKESFDNFVKDLKLILMSCEYSDPDYILTGIQHPRVQEKLQTKAKIKP